jgi:hypothetical protein
MILGSQALIEDSKDEIGLIAQEVQEIVPEVVMYDSLKKEYGIRYTRLIPLLIEAIKEQDKKIKDLDDKIKANQSQEVKSAGETDPSFENIAFLGKNRPNPFNENTTIEYYLPSDIQMAIFCVYDLSGKQLKSMTVTGRESGVVTIHGSELQPGMYYYSLIADGQVIGTEQMILTNN